LLLLFTSKAFGWTPSIRYVSPLDDPWGNLKQFWMPAFALAIQLMAIIMRMTRTTMLEVLGQDYVRTARAKGLRDRIVVVRHALRNALIPVITVIAVTTPRLMGGAVITESVFAWPGMGRLAANAAFTRDYPLVMAITMFVALLVVTSNLLADLCYGLLDPRIKLK
jgi:peptide/nickel transport system permease protein